MALKGQLLERLVVIPCGGPCLDGIYLRGDQGALLIASPLPSLEAGSMATPVSNELAYAAARSGCASLRLDYLGVGASEGEPPDGIEAAAAQLGEGLSFLLETAGLARCAVASYRSGAWAALALAQRDRRVDRLLLIAPDLTQPPPGAPTLSEVRAPILIVAAGDEPGFDAGAARELVEVTPHARIEVWATGAHFRSELVRLARLVPPFLGVVDSQAKDEGRRRGKLF